MDAEILPGAQASARLPDDDVLAQQPRADHVVAGFQLVKRQHGMPIVEQDRILYHGAFSRAMRLRGL